MVAICREADVVRSRSRTTVAAARILRRERASSGCVTGHDVGGGTLFVISPRGKGTIVTATLPLLDG